MKVSVLRTSTPDPVISEAQEVHLVHTCINEVVAVKLSLIKWQIV